jgi:3-hydroxyisobutyrate dehydrogenase
MTRGNIRVGLLGVGLMGSAMAHRLLDRGITVSAWDRDSEQLRGLEGRGGEAAKAPGEVLSGATVVITMLPTATVVLDVIEELLEDWPEGTVWLQMSSVGAAEADQLTGHACRRASLGQHSSRRGGQADDPGLWA